MPAGRASAPRLVDERGLRRARPARHDSARRSLGETLLAALVMTRQCLLYKKRLNTNSLALRSTRIFLHNHLNYFLLETLSPS